MISRCKFCGDIAPQGRTMCDSCYRLEYEDEFYYPSEDDDLLDAIGDYRDYDDYDN